MFVQKQQTTGGGNPVSGNNIVRAVLKKDKKKRGSKNKVSKACRKLEVRPEIDADGGGEGGL